MADSLILRGVLEGIAISILTSILILTRPQWLGHCLGDIFRKSRHDPLCFARQDNYRLEPYPRRTILRCPEEGSQGTIS